MCVTLHVLKYSQSKSLVYTAPEGGGDLACEAAGSKLKNRETYPEAVIRLCPPVVRLD